MSIENQTVDLAELQVEETLIEGAKCLIIRKTAIKDSKTSGEPIMQITFKVTSPSEEVDKTITEMISLQPQALFSLRGLLKGIGLVTGSMTYAEIASTLINKEVKADLSYQVYEGVKRPRLANYRSILS
jgi:hypothetical protein